MSLLSLFCRAPQGKWRCVCMHVMDVLYLEFFIWCLVVVTAWWEFYTQRISHFFFYPWRRAGALCYTQVKLLYIQMQVAIIILNLSQAISGPSKNWFVSPQMVFRLAVHLIETQRLGWTMVRATWVGILVECFPSNSLSLLYCSMPHSTRGLSILNIPGKLS